MLKDISIHRPIWMGFDDLKILSVAALCRREGGATLLTEIAYHLLSAFILIIKYLLLFNWSLLQ